MAPGKKQRRWGPLCLFVCLLLAPSIPTAGANPLDDWVRIREFVMRGDYDRAMDLADRLAGSGFGDLFQGLPDQVRAEQNTALGDPRTALDLFRRATPPGECLVAHEPSYWNSCQRMALLYRGVGDSAGHIEMLRRMSFGAGVRIGSSPQQSYLSLAEAYEEIGQLDRAAEYYRTVVHTFDDRPSQEQSQDALDRRGAPEGNPDDVILGNALSSDELLRRAGRVGLQRLGDTALAFETLFSSAVDPALRNASLEAMVELPVPDLEERLRERLHDPDGVAQELAQDGLRRMTGLTYPYVGADGEVRGVFDDSSPFAGVWGAPYLLERVADPYEADKVRLMALDALGHAGDLRGLETILQHTGSLSPAWRAHALHALRTYGGDRVENIVIGRLEDPDPLVRLIAAAGISRRDLPESVDLLAEALVRESDPLVAAAVVEAIAGLGSDEAIEALGELGPDLEGLAAAKAGEGLRLLGDPRGLELLRGAGTGGGPAAAWARSALSHRLDELDSGTDTPLLDLLVPPPHLQGPTGLPGPGASTQELFAASLLGIPPPADRALGLLESSRWSEYRGAAVALANTGVRTHLNAIRRRARSTTYGAGGSERVQYDPEMLEVLGLLEDDLSVPMLREVLLSSETRSAARAAAARSLGRLGDVDSAVVLLATFTDADSPTRVRRAAAWALSQVSGPELGPVVLGGLESPDPLTRRWTLQLLGDTGSEVGRDAAQRVAEWDPDPEVRWLAGLVSGSIGDPRP